MPLWNLCLAAALSGGYFVRTINRSRRGVRHIVNTLPEAPDKICRMTRKLARKMNLKNPEQIRVVVSDNLYGNSMFTPTFIKEIPGVLRISRYLCDEKFAKEKWKEYRNICENDKDMSTMDLIGNETKELRMAFGLNVPRNHIKFVIAHELAHLKYKDGVVRGIYFPCAWMVATVWPATNLVVAKMPQLQSLTYFKCEFIANVIDPLLFLDIVGVGSLWSLSYLLFIFCTRHLNHIQEFRADRTAAEMDVEIAKAGVVRRRGFNMYNQQILRLRKMQRFWGEVDADGELIKNDAHPKDIERIKAMEKVIDIHNAKNNVGND